MITNDKTLVLLAKTLAELDFDKEVHKQHALLEHKESILKRKSRSYEKELIEARKKNEHDLLAAGRLIQHWIKDLPTEQKENFERELKTLRELTQDPDFPKKILDSTLENKPLQNTLQLSDAFMKSLFKEGQRLQEQKLHHEAIYLNRLLFLLNPLFTDSLRALGYSHLCLKELQEAQNFFEMAVVLEPSNPKNYYLSALCNKELDEKENALIFCKEGLELSANQPVWQEMFHELKQSIRILA